MTDSDEPFLSRWSRLKREAAADRKQRDPEAGQEDAAGVQPGAEAAEPGSPGPRDHEPESDDSSHQTAPDLEEIDFDKLDSTSDYKRFMDGNVPDEVRRKALSKLWLSDPVLGGPEQLSDYMEDFSDAAVAATGGVVRTAYKVGQGFLSDEEAAKWDRLGRKEPVPPPAPAQVSVSPESPDQPEIAAFLAASDAYAQGLYPPESNHLVDLAALTAPNAFFYVARREGKALGCGALIIADDGWGEVKRMWVAPEARGQGVGRMLLGAIEAAAQDKGVAVLRLETGVRQSEAIGLYRRCGFSDCGPFGSYKPDPLSLFMEKRLAS